MKLDTGDLYLVIVAAGIPETHLNVSAGGVGEEGRKRLYDIRTFLFQVLKFSYVFDFVPLCPALHLLTLFLFVVVVRAVRGEEVRV